MMEGYEPPPAQKFVTTKPKQRPLWKNYDMWCSIVLVVNCLAILFIRNPGFGGASVFMAKVPLELMVHLPIRIDPKFPHPEYRNLTYLRRRAFCNPLFVDRGHGPKALQNATHVRNAAFLKSKFARQFINLYKKDSKTAEDDRTYDYIYLGFRKHSVCQLMPQTGLTEGSCWGIKKLDFCLGTPLAKKKYPPLVRAVRKRNAAAAKKKADEAKAVAAAAAVINGTGGSNANILAAKHKGYGNFANKLIKQLNSTGNLSLLIDQLSMGGSNESAQLNAIFATTTAAPTTFTGTTTVKTTPAPKPLQWFYDRCGQPNFCNLIKMDGKFRIPIAELGKWYMYLYFIGLIPIFLMLFDPPPAFWQFGVLCDLDMGVWAWLHPYFAAITMTAASACGFTWFLMQRALLEETVNSDVIRAAYPKFQFMYGYGTSFFYNLVPTTLTAIIFWVLIFTPGVTYPRFPNRLNKRRQRFDEEYRKIEAQAHDFLQKR